MKLLTLVTSSALTVPGSAHRAGPVETFPVEERPTTSWGSKQTENPFSLSFSLSPASRRGRDVSPCGAQTPQLGLPPLTREWNTRAGLLWGCQTCPVGWSRPGASRSLSLPSTWHTPLTPHTDSQVGQGLPLPKFQNFSPPPVAGINMCQWHQSLQRFHMG